jgi:drug/metabolite transporter (DMT)-like permease
VTRSLRAAASRADPDEPRYCPLQAGAGPPPWFSRRSGLGMAVDAMRVGEPGGRGRTPAAASSAMTIASPEPRTRALSAKAWGALAVVGVVIAFSLSSTLVKRAESPGVLVAFWRMVTVSLVWNAFLWSTGRRVTMKHVRQAFVPGVFFGINLATFFVGATHNSVANAALIGSLSPFLIVPLGAKLFREYIHPRALLFALVAFGGVTIVLFSAPPLGDASIRGNVFGVLAMFLWVGYVVSTRHFRRDMDVATFMATVSPIAACAVLPLALLNGDVLGMSSTGWTYMLLLTFLTGVAAHGLMVFAQRSIQIGTIGIAQVIQPALAVVWSFLLLDERLRHWQIIGIAIVVSGLLAFLVMNQRGGQRVAKPLT